MSSNFGNAGTVTTRKQVGGTDVNISAGEHLIYKITVAGVEGQFSLATDHILWNQDSFAGHPGKFYKREWPLAASEIDSVNNTYRLQFGFAFQPVQYTLVIEHHDRDHDVIEVLVDLDCQSTDPADTFAIALTLGTL